MPEESYPGMNSRLALGTASFGVAYGITNTVGKVPPQSVAAIIDCARRAGITTLDTAIAYGESEATLGGIGVTDWQVITKLPAFPDDRDDVNGWVESQIEGSLKRLRLSRIYGLLLHRPGQLLGDKGPALYSALCALKAQGRVAKIGVSVYQPEELMPLFKSMTFDIVQVPFSIVDRRLLDSGWMRRLHARDVELHVRSIFLQGLLLMLSGKRPEQFRRWQPLWNAWNTWLADNRITALEACLRYVVSFSEICKIVIGVETPTQLQDILKAASGDLPLVPEELESTDIDLLNPGRWSLL